MTRRYDRTHTKVRLATKHTVDMGQAHCTEPRCLMPTRAIHPGTPWDLAHDRTTGGYRGPAHAACNRSEGGTYARAKARMARSPIRRQLPTW